MSGSVAFDALVSILEADQLCQLRDACTDEIRKRDQEAGNAVPVCADAACTCRFILPFQLTTKDVSKESIVLDETNLVIYNLNGRWQVLRDRILACIRPLKVERIIVNENTGHAFLSFDSHLKAAVAQMVLSVKGGYKVNFSCHKETMEIFKIVRDEIKK